MILIYKHNLAQSNRHRVTALKVSYRVDGGEKFTPRGTFVADADGTALAYTPTGNAFSDFQKFGPQGSYQEVGFAACFIDY